MSLTRVQRLFIRLSKTNKRKWNPYPKKLLRRRKRSWNKRFPVTDYVRVNIINAVTGESTTAKSVNETAAKLKKWLKIRNLRAQFVDMRISPRSMWAQLPEAEWTDFPVIVKVGTYQVPYAIERRGDLFTVDNKTSCTIFLKAVNNVDYLSVIAEKKKIVNALPKLPPVVRKVTKKKSKKKSITKHKLPIFDDEDYFGA